MCSVLRKPVRGKKQTKTKHVFESLYILSIMFENNTVNADHSTEMYLCLYVGHPMIETNCISIHKTKYRENSLGVPHQLSKESIIRKSFTNNPLSPGIYQSQKLNALQ